MQFWVLIKYKNAYYIVGFKPLSKHENTIEENSNIFF